MSYATNGRDGARLYFEDEGGDGTPVVLYGGFLDKVQDLRESEIARALPRDEFRLVYADHRAQPYAWPDGPLTRVVTEGLAVSREERSMEPMVRAFEDFWEVGFPKPQRERWLDNDPLALEAAWSARDEGAIADDLGRWQIPCLIFLGAADADFLEGARRAAEEILGSELLVLEEADHYTAHMSQDEILLDAVLRTLRRRD